MADNWLKKVGRFLSTGGLSAVVQHESNGEPLVWREDGFLWTWCRHCGEPIWASPTPKWNHQGGSTQQNYHEADSV